MWAASTLGWSTGVVGWLFLARSSSKAWQVLGFTGALEGSTVECCVPVTCAWLGLPRFHFGAVCLVAQLSRAPPCPVQYSLWPGASLSPGFFLPETTLVTISKICVELLRAQAKQVLPPQPSLWDPWSTSQLSASTLCLQRHRAQAAVTPAVKALRLGALESVAPLGRSSRFRRATSNGAGSRWVRSAQVAPHPAVAWPWYAVQQYHCWAEQHIDCAGIDSAFELLACAYRYRIFWQDVRLFHIFDKPRGSSGSRKGAFLFPCP